MPAPFIHHEGSAYPALPGESVLDTLLRHGVKVPYSCKAGICGSCTMRAAAGTRLSPGAQDGLKETLQQQGYFHACRHFPAQDIEVIGADAELEVAAQITSLDLLSPSVLRVHLRCDAPFEYQAGQFVTLIRPDGLARSYSLASLPHEEELELHVRLLPGGRMSGWLRDSAKPGERVKLRGPSGACFYVAGQPHQPLVLAGTGTGLAPLYGILRDALRSGHAGEIRLFHGARDEAGLYLRAELEALAAGHELFHYTPCVLEGDAGCSVPVGQIDQVILSRTPELKQSRGFLCGDAPLVQSLKKKLFLAGMSLKAIHADSFLPAA